MSVDRHSPGSLCSVLSAQCSVVQVQVVLIGIPCRCGPLLPLYACIPWKASSGGREVVGRAHWKEHLENKPE